MRVAPPAAAEPTEPGAPVVLVELEEGVRLISNMEGTEPDDVYFGMPVEVTFDDLADDLTLFKFVERKAGGDD